MTLNIVTSPQILNDSIFTQYGGEIGTASPAQLQAAYAMAEGMAVQEIGTYLSPTTTTGTYSWPPNWEPLQVQHTHLISVGNVTAVHDAGCDCADDAIEIEGCAWILDADGGLVSLRECTSSAKANCSGCGCGCCSGNLLQARIVYTAGLPNNAADDTRLLMGLVTAADLSLEQIIDRWNAEGGPGDPGVNQYSSIGYSEKRFELRLTAFGASARANYAANILREFKFNRALKLGW
jgi:hypothetical protein